MEVTYRRRNTTYENVEIGEVFQHDAAVFIKTAIDKDSTTAVDLFTGISKEFRDDMPVLILRATMRIEE